MRIYDPRLGKFLSVDPLTKDYPELTPYQFATNSPLMNIDLDGLEGVQNNVVNYKVGGNVVITRVVALDIHVGTSQNQNSVHFKSADIEKIRQNLNSEFNNKGFKDEDGNLVEFSFNLIEFDVDKTKPEDYAKALTRDIECNLGLAPPPVSKGFQRGAVMIRQELEYPMKGLTVGNLIKIGTDPNNASHNEAHEVVHVFLNYSNINPVTVQEHADVGGVMQYKVVDPEGNVISDVKPVNQKNIDDILKFVPYLGEETKQESIENQ